MSGDPPRPFEVLLWGTQHPRVVQALTTARCPQGVNVTVGVLGATLRIPHTTDAAWVERLLDRLSRALREGDLYLGLNPDVPLSASELQDAWRAFLRTRGVPPALSHKRPEPEDDEASALFALTELFRHL